MPKSRADDEAADSQPVFDEDGGHSSSSGQRAAAAQQDWQLLATAIDRIAFIVYCFLFICFALAYLT